MGEQIKLPFPCHAAALKILQDFQAVAPRAPGSAVLATEFSHPGVGVEHGELALGGEQTLMVVRAVQINQMPTQAFENTQRGGRIVDELLVG